MSASESVALGPVSRHVDEYDSTESLGRRVLVTPSHRAAGFGSKAWPIGGHEHVCLPLGFWARETITAEVEPGCAVRLGVGRPALGAWRRECPLGVWVGMVAGPLLRSAELRQRHSSGC